MHKLPLTAALAACAIASGCSTTGGEAPAEPISKPMQCDVGGVQDYVGKPANVANGTAIRDRSGAQSLRWGAPDSVWTMDYRTDRVNVRYNKDMIITEITCG